MSMYAYVDLHVYKNTLLIFIFLISEDLVGSLPNLLQPLTKRKQKDLRIWVKLAELSCKHSFYLMTSSPITTCTCPPLFLSVNLLLCYSLFPSFIFYFHPCSNTIIPWSISSMPHTGMGENGCDSEVVRLTVKLVCGSTVLTVHMLQGGRLWNTWTHWCLLKLSGNTLYTSSPSSCQHLHSPSIHGQRKSCQWF